MHVIMYLAVTRNTVFVFFNFCHLRDDDCIVAIITRNNK